MNRDLELAPLAYSVNDAARVTSMSRAKMWRLISNGHLRARKIGGRTLIPADVLRAFISAEEAA